MFAGFDVTAVYEPEADGTIKAIEEGKAPSLGTVIFNQNKWYKFVKYNEGTAALDLAAGDVVTYVDDSGYAANEVTADASDATGKNIGAGVATAAVTVTGSYFWVQIKGAATLNTAIGGAGSDGDCLTAEAAADKALTLATDSGAAADSISVVAIAVDYDAKEIICDFPW